MAERRLLHWTDAFTAYEQEFDVLEAVRADYLSYVDQTLQGARTLVNARLGEESIKSEKDVGGRPFLELAMLPRMAGLRIQAWATRMNGAEAGKLRVIICLADTSSLAREAGPTSFQWREEATLAALSSASGERYAPANCPELAHDKQDPVAPERVVWTWTIPLNGPDASQQLAAVLLEAHEGASRAATALLRGREGDATLWARLRLLEIQERFPLSARRDWYPKEGLGDDWDDQKIDGRYLGLLAKDDKHPNWLYIAVLANGDIRVVHDGGFERVRKATLQKKLGVSPEDAIDGLPSVTLLKGAEVAAMMRAGKSHEFMARIHEILETFSLLYR